MILEMLKPKKLFLLLNTVKYLKLKQIIYRLFYVLRSSLFPLSYKPIDSQNGINLLIFKPKGFYLSGRNALKKEGKYSFTFLNITHNFLVDDCFWNYNEHGKLWTYNLNYFEFLDTSEKWLGEELINKYINDGPYILDGMEPYPVSLRIIFWVKFLSQHQIVKDEIGRSLFGQLKLLEKSLEYHLLGNHLLENAFALIFGAYFFHDKEIMEKGERILIDELDEQILKDGAHFELSPMYHQTILFRLLETINLIQSNNKFLSITVANKLVEKAELMLAWLDNISFKNGDVPLVNDSTILITPTTQELKKYASLLGINYDSKKTILSDSGYRMWRIEEFELFTDVGQIGASYIPGHAHADSLSFVLYFKGMPLIIDPGVSTYEKCESRDNERSTSYHNTVDVDGVNSTEVWSGFRVGSRAVTRIIEESEYTLNASHNGYSKLGLVHQRTFKIKKDKIEIEDLITGGDKRDITANFHFKENANIVVMPEKKQVFVNDVELNFIGDISEILLEEYALPLAFNITVPSKKLKVNFKSKLKIIITEEIK